MRMTIHKLKRKLLDMRNGVYQQYTSVQSNDKATGYLTLLQDLENALRTIEGRDTG